MSKLTLPQLERHLFAAADIQNEDTLSTPLHLEGSELMRFDRVISNPPFSQNYSRAGMKSLIASSMASRPKRAKKAI